jgi:hypothetical protein
VLCCIRKGAHPIFLGCRQGQGKLRLLQDFFAKL